jgi:HEPN domain-containing protein
MRPKDWIEQAKRTINSAEHSAQGGYFEDAAFLSHHAAMLGAIELLTRKGIVSTGQSVYYLLKQIDNVKQDLLHKARLLDTYYTPSRYPYCFEKGSPKDYFDEEIAKEAINCAKAILEYVETEVG